MFNNKVVKVGILVAGMMTVPMVAEARELIAALLGPIETAYGQAMEKFGDRVSELTNGEITVKIFPDGQLGGNNETFEQLIGGQIDIGVGVPGVIAEYTPQMQAFVVPFIFKDFDHWKRTVSGPVGAKINALVKEQANIQVMGYFGGSIRNLISSKEVKSLDDVKGLRIRLHPTKVLTAAWGSVGIQPTVMAYGEIYSGLQLGVIDGLENEPEWVLRMKFHEQAKYYVITEHEIVTRPFMISGKTFDSLTESQKAAMVKAGQEAAIFEQELENGLDATSRNELAEKYSMNLVQIDKPKFQAIVQEALVPVIEKQGISDLVKEILAQ